MQQVVEDFCFPSFAFLTRSWVLLWQASSQGYSPTFVFGCAVQKTEVVCVSSIILSFIFPFVFPLIFIFRTYCWPAPGSCYGRQIVKATLRHLYLVVQCSAVVWVYSIILSFIRFSLCFPFICIFEDASLNRSWVLLWQANSQGYSLTCVFGCAVQKTEVVCVHSIIYSFIFLFVFPFVFPLLFPKKLLISESRQISIDQ